MSSKIIFIIFLILAAGVLLYVVRSGIVSEGLQALATPFHTSGGSFFQPSPQGGNANSGFVESSTDQTQISQTPTSTPGGPWMGVATSSITSSDIPQGFTVGQLSPFFHAVRLNGASYGSFGSYGQIALSANNLPASATVDITNWQIKTRISGEYIPQAINLYDPSGLTSASDIILKNGDTAYLYSSTGPFNLRLNECIGYIGQQNHFNPPLPTNCPQLDRSQIQYFSGACQNYINSLGGCALPNLNKAPIPYNDYSCMNYLANISYKGCFDAHAHDVNFLSNQVLVWTGSNVVDQYHDIVELLDRQGLVVDVYSY